MTDQDFRDRVVLAAIGQVGKPYVWGGNGPDGYDCSGFVLWVWRQVGLDLPDQTADQLWRGLQPGIGPPKAGDLAFYSSPGKPGKATHVVLILQAGGNVVAGANGGGPPDKGETPDAYAARMRARNAMVRVEDARRNGTHYRDGHMGIRRPPLERLKV